MNIGRCWVAAGCNDWVAGASAARLGAEASANENVRSRFTANYVSAQIALSSLCRKAAYSMAARARSTAAKCHGSWHSAPACTSQRIVPLDALIYIKINAGISLQLQKVEPATYRRSQTMLILSAARTVMIASAVFLLFGASAYSFELNGAWASDPSICSKIFVKQNTKLVMTSDADNYGSGFVVDGNQVRGKIATCNIKSRKEEAGLVHLITSCSTDVALQTVQLSFKVDDDNRVTRIFPGSSLCVVS
jgi:hypothetical protein